MMPSKKRRRAASADADAATHGTVAASFELYPLLPLELREFIIEIACLTPRLPSSPHPPSPFGVDSATTFSLSLVCRQISAQVTPLLWRTISITRPSSLYALREALLSRPDRRKLIVSLHIGPQDVLPSYWWPLSTVWCGKEYVKDDEFLQVDAATKHEWIASSLDQESLPSGCVDRQAWEYERRPDECRASAIEQAIKEAGRILGVSLLDYSGNNPNQIERVLLVQAALDLFLERVREVEEEHPALTRLAQPGRRVPEACGSGECRHYPALHISSVPQAKGTRTTAQEAPQRQTPANAITVSYAQLLRHLGRRGALTDRFDHPILFERSGFKVNMTAPSTKGSRTFYPSSARYFLGSRTWSLVQHTGERWPGFDSLRSAAARPQTSKTISDSYSAVMFTATLGSIIRLAQNVLYLAKYVQSLSLSGSLQHAVGGPDARALPRLRRLSLGPAPPNWAIDISFPKLANLESFRIGETSFTVIEARLLLAEAPKLKRIHCNMARPFQCRYGGNVEDVFVCLLTASLSATTLSAAGKQSSGTHSKEQPDVSPLITATLHPIDVSRVHAIAQSPEVRAAWLVGRATSGNTCRLRLRESNAAGQEEKEEADDPLDSQSEVCERVYEEEREWWREELG